MGRLNPRWNEELPADAEARAADSDRRFEKAAALAGGEFWERLDYTVQAWLPAREIVERALAARKEKSGEPSGRVLVFDEYASWKVRGPRSPMAPGAHASPQDHVYTLEKDLSIPEAEQIIYVVYPDEAGSYRVQAVPEHADSFNSRRALPEQWRGVRDEQLSEKSGIPGCVFVHASGFIGGEHCCPALTHATSHADSPSEQATRRAMVRCRWHARRSSSEAIADGARKKDHK